MGTPKTRAFQDLLQENYQEVIGLHRLEVSRTLAWKLFKASFATAVQFLMRMSERVMEETGAPEDVALPLKGVGNFKIAFRRPRPIGGKPCHIIKKTNWVPKFRFVASTKWTKIMLEKLFNVVVEVTDKDLHVERPQRKARLKKWRETEKNRALLKAQRERNSKV